MAIENCISCISCQPSSLSCGISVRLSRLPTSSAGYWSIDVCFNMDVFFVTRKSIYDKGRSAVRNSLTPSTMQSALQRILPFPCKKRYTVVILMPQESRLKFLNSLFLRTVNGISRDSKVVVGIAGAVVIAISIWRYSQRT